MTIVVIDFETGGILPPNENTESILFHNGLEGMCGIYYDPPLWVAAIAYDREFRELETLDIKIKADISMCDRGALDICHYDHKLWEAEALEPKAVAYLLKEFFQRHTTRMVSSKGNDMFLARLVGFNIAGFDIHYLRKLFEWAKPWDIGAATWAGRNTGIIDIMWHCQVYGIMIGKEFRSLRLEDVYQELFDETFPAHNPLEDCRATARIARNIMFTMRQAWEFLKQPRESKLNRCEKCNEMTLMGDGICCFCGDSNGWNGDKETDD